MAALFLLTRALGAQGNKALSLDSLLETRVSSAAKYKQTIREAAGGVTIISADDIAAYGYRTLDQALASARGLYLSYDRNYTYLGARGFSRPTDYNNRILLLIDGHLSNEGIWGTAPVGGEAGIDLAAVERIEIVRGPGSALYGTGALFGIINIVTKTSTGPNLGQISGEAGSLGLRRATALYGKSFSSDARVFVLAFTEQRDGGDLHIPELDDPGSGNGVAKGLDWERRSGVFVGATFGGWTLHGRYSSRDKGIPTGAYNVVITDSASWTRDDYGFLELKRESVLGRAVTLTSRAYYDRYWYTGDYSEPDEFWREAAANDVLGTESLLRWDVRADNRLTVGAEVRRNMAARYYPRDATTPLIDLSVPHSVYSVFVQDEIQVSDRVNLVGGFRHDWYSTTGGATTPRAGLVVDASRTTALKLLYGEGFRAPNIFEAQNESSEHKLNPDLGAERLRSGELIWQQTWGSSLLSTVSLYTLDVNGLIDLTADPADGLFVFRNIGTVRSRGAEIGLDVRLGQAMRGYASYSAQRARDLETGEVLTNSPTHQARAGSSVRAARWLQSAIELRYESGRRTVYDTWTDDFLITDLHLGLQPRLGRGRVEASLKVSNLFDVDYATPGGVEHRQAAIVQDGRTLSVRLSYQF